MGLDMYAYAIDKNKLVKQDQQTDIELVDGAEPREIEYWRKFNHLHGWMHDLYVSKGGKSDQFNCNTVCLTEDDLTLLENLVKAGPLPSRMGFFFGGSEWEEGYTEGVIDFIKNAREELKLGNVVFYDSWW